MKTVSCHECGYKARDSFNLKRHLKSHREPRHVKSICSDCGYVARDGFNLSQHKMKHVARDKRCRACIQTFSTVEEAEKHKGACRKMVTCAYCNKQVSNKLSLRRHIQKIHFSSNANKILNKQCPLCPTKCSSLDINEHLTKEHGKRLDDCVFRFENPEKFHSWKNELENSTNCYYTNRYTKKNSLGSRIVYYHCHRSGYAKLKSPDSRMRELKILGSNKINAYCPARLWAAFSKDESVTVNGITTHVGHDFHPGRQYLSKHLREELAEKIASKIPFSDILSSYTNNVEDSPLSRDNLITQKDLHNIARDFKLDKVVAVQKNDILAVKTWIQYQINSQTHFVRYFKLQGNLDPQYPQLNENDFILVLISDSQVQVLKEFGSNVVHLDGTKLTSVYNFVLLTIVVSDNRFEGIPCAFLLSSRYDAVTMSLFLDLVAGLSGRLVCEVLITDVDDLYYNAWVTSMGSPKSRLFCSRRVDEDWTKNLTLIEGEIQNQREVYRRLREIQIERDESNFSVMFDQLLVDLLDDETTERFGNYLLNNFSLKNRNWAYCFRSNSNANSNTVFERMHALVEYLRMKGNLFKRIDNTVYALENIHSDKVNNFAPSSIKVEEKLKKSPQVILQRHKNSLEVDFIVNEFSVNEWLVSTSTQFHPFSVQQLKSAVCDSCPCVCEQCQACSHMYICSCLDNTMGRNMCVHIHAVCRSSVNMASNKEVIRLEDSANTVIPDDVPSALVQDKFREILHQPATPNRSLDDAKEKMTALIDTATNNEEIDAVYYAISSLGATLEELKARSLSSGSPPKPQASPYRIIISQVPGTTDSKYGEERNNDRPRELVFTLVGPPVKIDER